jgi:hypothetical protein
MSEEIMAVMVKVKLSADSIGKKKKGRGKLGNYNPQP